MNKIYIGLLLLASLFIYSCDEMNDLHEGYLEEGETIYAAKVDSVSANPGDYRIELDLIIASQRVDFVRVYWNDYTDSSDVVIGNQVGLFSTTLENMEERSYIFQCVSFDAFGNSSLPHEEIGKVYGDNYQTTLANRRVSVKLNTTDTTNTVALHWTILNTLDRGVALEYADSVGNMVQQTVMADENITYIENWKAESNFTYSTFYVPAENAIDIFEADTEEGVFPELP